MPNIKFTIDKTIKAINNFLLFFNFKVIATI